MFELIDIQPDINVLESEYKRLLGFPGAYILEGRVRDLAEWARRWYAENGKPWIYARQTPLQLVPDRLRINGAEFASKRLHEQLHEAQAHAAMMTAVSAGKECEEKARQLWQEGKPDEYFFIEVFGSAVVEHLVTNAGARICAWAEQNGMVALPHYSPGYSGWDVAEQTRFFEVLRPHNGNGLPGEIHVLQSGMLRPKKSLLALIGITQQVERVKRFANLIPCENCSFSPCQYRRTPYKNALPQIEDVRRLQPPAPERSAPNGANGSGLNHQARYSINPRALQKWSQERLRLLILDDHSVEAEFRYEGTTCSNLGSPLEFDYHVKLSPSQDGYRILGANCRPSPEDAGHTRMCEYVHNAEQLMANIGKEKPLRGRPLDDVLKWERQYSPAGCYCDSGSRLHKWGLVLEVIHYALVQHEKNQTTARQLSTNIQL